MVVAGRVLDIIARDIVEEDRQILPFLLEGDDEVGDNRDRPHEDGDVPGVGGWVGGWVSKI